MNINISKETKFNVGDEVYAIDELDVYNDYYRNETEWKVLKEDYSREPIKFKITNIKLEYITNNKGSRIKVFYTIDNTNYEESLLFKTLEDAENECKKLNKPSYL